MIFGSKIALGTLALLGQFASAGPNNAAVLTQKLTEYYRPVRAEKAGGGATSPGLAPKLWTVRQSGILGLPIADASFLDSCPSIFRSGKLRQSPGFFCSELANKSQKKLKIEDRVYVTNILVSLTLDRISFYLACDSCGAGTPHSALRSLVVFDFRKGYLSKAAADEIVPTIRQILAADPGTVDAPPVAAAAPQGATQGTAAAPETAAPESNMETTAATTIVKKGQTPEAVEKILGKPQAIFDLEAKLVYVYPNMKVLFVGGKLTDVQ